MATRDWSRPLASVNETLLLVLVSFDFVRTGSSNVHRCHAFPFALAGIFLSHIPLGSINSIIVAGCVE